MSTVIPSLKDLYKTLADLMLEDVRIGHYDNYETNCLLYEDDGWYIECIFKIVGDWIEDGDGYMEPREYYCKSAWGSIDKLSVSYYDEDDNEIEIPEAEIDALYSYLEKELESYCRNV